MTDQQAHACADVLTGRACAGTPGLGVVAAAAVAAGVGRAYPSAFVGGTHESGPVAG